MNKVRNEKIVYVIGCPGSGKGTLCSMLTEMTTFRHLSVGDLLRQQDRDGLITDPRIQDCLRAGELVPVEFLSRLLESSFLDRENESCNYILLDGFPRRLDQIHPIQKVIGRPQAVLLFNCPKEIAQQRVLHRLLPGRNQDGAVFESRHAEFCLNNPDIVKYFQADQLLIEVDTSGPTPVSYELLVRAMRNSGLFGEQALNAIVSA